MDTLPEYLQDVNPWYLELDCNKKLHESCISQGSSQWNNISHIRKHNIVCIRDLDMQVQINIDCAIQAASKVAHAYR
jgi:hypothetical protein